MKQTMSLEEEKRRLLAQLESSRAIYRRILTDEDPPSPYEPSAAYHYAAMPKRTRFPRSQTMQWLVEHPYLAATGAIAVAMVGKRAVSSRKHKRKTGKDDQDSSVKKGFVATTLGTAVAMMLRNPAQMRAALRAVSIAVNYFKSRQRRL